MRTRNALSIAAERAMDAEYNAIVAFCDAISKRSMDSHDAKLEKEIERAELAMDVASQLAGVAFRARMDSRL